MKTVFCTIITANYIHYAMTLFESLIKQKENIHFVIAISDMHNFNAKILDKRITIVSLKELKEVDDNAKKIYAKYFPKLMNKLRWSMKPILLKYLLLNNYNKAIFLDCDLFFCDNFDLFIDELDIYDIILTPHWRTLSPFDTPEEFSRQYSTGIYNAGFIAVNKNGIEMLNWWATVCAYKCKAEYSKGFFDDQKYLDIVPLYFKNVKISHHLGCNLASWNIDYCKRSLNPSGQVKINGIWDVVFVHMTARTIRLIEEGKDHLLLPFLKKWQEALEQNRNQFGIPKPTSENGIKKVISFFRKNLLKLKKLKIIIEE